MLGTLPGTRDTEVSEDPSLLELKVSTNGGSIVLIQTEPDFYFTTA